GRQTQTINRPCADWSFFIGSDRARPGLLLVVFAHFLMVFLLGFGADMIRFHEQEWSTVYADKRVESRDAPSHALRASPRPRPREGRRMGQEAGERRSRRPRRGD